MLFCKDCKFHEPSKYSTSGNNLDKCNWNVKVSMVTGEISADVYCDVSRKSLNENTCGINAKFFELKGE